MTAVMTQTWTLDLHLRRRHQRLKEGGGGRGRGGGRGGRRGIVLGQGARSTSVTYDIRVYIYITSILRFVTYSPKN